MQLKKKRHSAFKFSLGATLSSAKKFKSKYSIAHRRKDQKDKEQEKSKYERLNKSGNKTVEKLKRKGVYDQGEFMSNSVKKYSRIEVEK